MIKIGQLRQHAVLDEILYFIVDFYDYYDLAESDYYDYYDCYDLNDDSPCNFVTAFIFWKDSPLNGKIISGNINWFLDQTIPIDNGTK